MTCKDCIYYDNTIIDFVGNSDIEYHVCKHGDYWKAVKNTDKPCKHFKNNDGTYDNGSWHCPRCGRPVPKWGLCDECSRLYDSWDEVSK